ncbi:MAG: hypothetical protein PUP91_24990 [Rhizonema sp. PD37]|nr:hypothetical protein [Rhizonema sp. PD37]
MILTILSAGLSGRQSGRQYSMVDSRIKVEDSTPDFTSAYAYLNEARSHS